MRHGEAVTSSKFDKDRTLTEKGKCDLSFMKIEDYDLVLVSTALRTKETWSIISKNAKFKEVKYLDELYLASSEKLYEVYLENKENFNSVLFIAHNPGIENLYYELSSNYISFTPGTHKKLTSNDFKKWFCET